MTSSSSVNTIPKSKTAKVTFNCSEFSKSVPPNLKEMDNYMFVEYTGQGHLHPQRVASARSRNVASVKLTYFTSDHLSYLKNSSKDINMLDLTSSNLFKLPADLISEMSNLQIIILDNNQLSETSISSECSDLLGKSVKEISICNNHFTTLIPNMDKFVKLLRLKMSNNAISNLKGIDKLNRLKWLMVQHNDISQLGPGFYLIKRLENVYISHNKLLSISMAIRNLVHLREIDLSNNSLKTVPGDLFLLPKVEIIKLNNNKLNKIPKFKITPRLSCPIAFVDLSFNNIIRFPDCVLRITSELDLSNNKIKTVTSSILNKISFLSTQKLYLKNNPIIDPPLEICESGLKAMLQYYEEFEGTEAKYYGIKLFCFGVDTNNLKNRLVNVLNDQADDEDLQGDAVEILEMYDRISKTMTQPKSEILPFNIKIVNINEETNNFDPLIFFLTSPSLNLIVVDVDNWSDKLFDKCITDLLTSFLCLRTEIVFSIVCITKRKIDDSTLSNSKLIKDQVEQFLGVYTDEISEEIRKIESKHKITASMSQSLKRLIQLKSIKFNVLNNVLEVNIEDSKSTKRFESKIMKIFTDKSVFPNIGNQVPSFWSDVQTFIEEECYQFPIISFEEFESLLQHRFNLKPVIKHVAKYLHEVGCILWSEENLPPLNDWIITSPQLLVECCRVLFQQDLKTYLEDPNNQDTNRKHFKKRFPHSRFGYRHCCDALLNDAILLPELAFTLFESIIPEQYVVKMLFYLCHCWNLGYIIEYSGLYCHDWSIDNVEIKDNVSDTTSSVVSHEFRGKSPESRQSRDSRRSQDSKKTHIPPIFLTLLCTKEQCSPEALDQWQMQHNLKLAIYYRFPRGYPKIIFHQATVRVSNRAKFNINRIDHWKDGFQAQIKDESIFFRIQRFGTVNKDSIIQYEFLHRDLKLDSNVEENESFRATKVWKFIHEILLDMDALLNSYQGLWFERLVICPFCNEPSFHGTWHSYNDNDSSEGEQCSACNEIVPFYRLEPPKVSKNISVEEIIKNIRRQFDRE